MANNARHSDGSTQFWTSASTLDWSGASASPAGTWRAIMTALWFQTDLVDGNNRYLLSIGDWINDIGALAKFRSSNSSYMSFKTSAPAFAEYHFTDTPTVGSWYHLATVWYAQGGVAICKKMLINGVLKTLLPDFSDTTITRLVANRNLWVGTYNASTGTFPFSGAYTDLGIWVGPDDSLFPSDADVAALYAGTKRPNQVGTGLQTWTQTGGTGLRLYYPLNGSTGTEAESGGGPSLTLTGSLSGTVVSGPSQLAGGGAPKFRRNLGRRAGSRGHRAFIY